jgi:hypothetical protein
MKKAFAAAALAASFALTQAQAQGPDFEIPNPRGMVAYFDVESLQSILSDMNYVYDRELLQAQTGQPYLRVSANGKVVFMLIPTACKGANFSKCVGLNVVAIMSGDRFNYQTVTAFNQRYPFSTAGMARDGKNAYVSRYEIADYGIPRGNVAESIVNLLILADKLRDELATSKKTVSLEGYADDLSAANLNSNSLMQLAGVAASESISRHQAAMEDSIELVLALIGDEETPRNKVQNLTVE